MNQEKSVALPGSTTSYTENAVITPIIANIKHLSAMVVKDKQRKKKNFKNYGKSNKELNALIEKNFRNLLKIRRGGKQTKNYNTFRKCSFQTMKTRIVSQAFSRAEKAEKSQPPALNE